MLGCFRGIPHSNGGDNPLPQNGQEEARFACVQTSKCQESIGVELADNNLSMEQEMSEKVQYDMEFVSHVLRIFDEYDQRSDLFFRTGERYGGGSYASPASFFADCSDAFWWGGADLEEITPDNVCELERAMADTKAVCGFVGAVYGAILFASRLRKLRPQGAAYPTEQALWPLFDACGPPRKVEVGNPKPHPGEVPIIAD